MPAVPRVTGQSTTQVSLEILGKIVPHLSGSGGPGAAGLESPALVLTGGPKHDGNCFYLKKKKKKQERKETNPKQSPPAATEDNHADKKMCTVLEKGLCCTYKLICRKTNSSPVWASVHSKASIVRLCGNTVQCGKATMKVEDKTSVNP